MIINRPATVSTSSIRSPKEIAQAGLLAAAGHDDAGRCGPRRCAMRCCCSALGLFVVVAATAYGQIRLNRWNQPFYDALSHRNFAEFLHQLGVFGIIAGALLVLNVAQRWLGETLKLQAARGAGAGSGAELDGARARLPAGERRRRSASIPISACTRMRAI